MEKEIYGFKSEEVELIKRTVGKDAVNEAEFHRFLYRANKLGLNPLDGTIHLQARNRKNPETRAWEKTNIIIVGIEALRAVGDVTGKLSGIKRWVEYDDKGKLRCGVAQVFRSDWKEPATEAVPFSEFCQIHEGKPSGMWASKPETMIKKCAEAAAHRMAWPAALAGIYIPEEMMQEDEEPKKTGKADTKADKAAPKVDPPKVTPPEDTKATPPVEPPKATTPTDPTATTTPAAPPADTKATPPGEQPKTETPKVETAGETENFEYQIKITSAPTEAKGKVVVVGTDMLKDDEINLVGVAEGIKDALRKLIPGNVVEVNGPKKESEKEKGKIFVLVEAIKVAGETVPVAEKPAEPVVEKPAEQPAAGKPAEPPKEESAAQSEAAGPVKLQIAVTKPPKAGNYEGADETCEVYYLSGATEKGENKVAFCKSSEKCAFPFTCTVVGDVIEITGSEIEYKGKKVILITNFEIVQQAQKEAS